MNIQKTEFKIRTLSHLKNGQVCYNYKRILRDKLFNPQFVQYLLISISNPSVVQLFCESILLIRLSISAKIAIGRILTFEQQKYSLFFSCLQNLLSTFKKVKFLFVTTPLYGLRVWFLSLFGLEQRQINQCSYLSNKHGLYFCFTIFYVLINQFWKFIKTFFFFPLCVMLTQSLVNCGRCNLNISNISMSVSLMTILRNRYWMNSLLATPSTMFLCVVGWARRFASLSVRCPTYTWNWARKHSSRGATNTRQKSLFRSHNT